MEMKEFKVPLYKDEKGNEYISAKHINDGINGKRIKEGDFFDSGNIQGEIKKDNIIDLSSYNLILMIRKKLCLLKKNQP